MEQRVTIGIEHKPETDALLSGLKGFNSEQKSYILGVIDGTAAQIARERVANAAPCPTA